MKKSLISALTTALVVGAASTTFAAANPFEDVPADHWAYDAIAQLAADGVIEGYGDGTYRGDQEITRYEMAQMVARAMAKNASGVNKAMIDKLAAEFADELNSLGVRVAALEKKVDNVRWKGFVAYENYTVQQDASKNGTRAVSQYFRLRLDPVMTINKNWIAKARINYYSDANAASNATGAGGGLPNGINLDRMWAEGNYNNLKIQLGKVHYVGKYEGHAGGMVFDNRISGGIVTFGNKLKVELGAGRRPGSESMQFITIGGDASDKFGANVGFFRVSKDTKYGENGTFARAWDDDGKVFNSRDRNIWKVGFDYRFTPQLVFNAVYARGNGDWETKFKQAYSVELSYNGGSTPDFSKPGNFGAFLAYRHLGAGAVIAPVYDGMYWNMQSQKGFEVGLSYIFAKNVQGKLLYFRGKDIGVNEDRDSQQFFGQLAFWF